MKINERIVEKVTSARWLTTLLVVGTYCGIILLCLVLAMKDKLSVEAFLGVFAGFSGLASLVVKSYFDRRQDEKNINGSNDTGINSNSPS